MFVLASMAWPPLLPTAVAAAVFFWPIRRLGLGRWSTRTPADLLILLLTFMIPVTVWTTAIPEKTIPQAYRLLTGIAIYYAIVNWSNAPKRLRLITIGVTSIGLCLALIAPFSVEWSVGKLPIPAALYEHFVLLVSDTIHPNVLAGNIVIFFPISASLLLFLWDKANLIKRLFLAVATIIPLCVIIITQSRGAWMACAVILVTLFALRWRWGWIGFGVASVLLIILASFLGRTRSLGLVCSGGSIG
ncbi:MAG: hypothetical protein QW279_08020, partial [Candidatus Jordarchaeaceae archaeon]